MNQHLNPTTMASATNPDQTVVATKDDVPKIVLYWSAVPPTHMEVYTMLTFSILGWNNHAHSAFFGCSKS